MTRVASSWVAAVGWLRLPAEYRSRPEYRGCGWVLVETRDGRRYAHLARPWVYGLLRAALASGRSIGRTVNQVLYRHQEAAGVRLDEVAA